MTENTKRHENQLFSFVSQANPQASDSAALPQNSTTSTTASSSAAATPPAQQPNTTTNCGRLSCRLIRRLVAPSSPQSSFGAAFLCIIIQLETRLQRPEQKKRLEITQPSSQWRSLYWAHLPLAPIPLYPPLQPAESHMLDERSEDVKPEVLVIPAGECV